MLRTTIKVAIRHLMKEKVFTLMNLVGLAVALAASLFIVQFVITEFSYDDGVPKGDRKYRLTLKVDNKGDQQTYATNFYPVGPAALQAIPGIVDYNRFYYLDRHAIVTVDNQKFNEMDVLFADLNFFEFFDYPLKNDLDQAAVTNGAYLSQDMASKYFADQDPAGQLLKVNTEDGEHLFKVAGVFAHTNGLSHLNPQIVLPISRLTTLPLYQRFQWIWNFFGTYIELNSKADKLVVEHKINQLLQEQMTEKQAEREFYVELQPIAELHLNPDLNYEYARVGSGLITTYLLYAVVFILILAYVNYINITNARNSLRIKEIGVKKVLGSGRYQIGMQLLAESFLVNLGAIVLSLTMIQGLLPILKVAGIDLTFNLFSESYFMPGLILLLFVGTVITGVLPSWIMSGVKASDAINKMSKTSKSGAGLRKIMVLGQFAITMIMITSVMIMRSQLNFMIDKDKGVDLEQVVVVNGPRASMTSITENNVQGLINEFNSIPGVKNTSVSTSVPGVWMGNSTLTSSLGSSDEIAAQSYRVSAKYFECYGINLIAGRFLTDNPADQESMVLNESGLVKLGFSSQDEILNQTIRVSGSEKRVVGIVRDYHHFNLKEPVYPTSFLPFRDKPEYISFKLESTENQEVVLSTIEQVWNKFYPEDPFDYFYQDNLFQRAHVFESKVVETFSMFTVLAIFIASLGLIGLATFITNLRIKEIGIRKVLGATVNSLLYLLVKDFLFLIVLGLLLGIPVVYYGMTTWLDNYAYRIDFPWWVIPAAGLSLLIITLTVVSTQTVKTALTNPVDALKCE